jgi:hypothetical protein
VAVAATLDLARVTGGELSSIWVLLLLLVRLLRANAALVLLAESDPTAPLAAAGAGLAILGGES